jgi:nicotinamidase-related amidase
MAAKTALVVIDVQQGLLYPPSGPTLDGAECLLDRVGTLLQAARAQKLPVVFVRHDGGPGDDLEAGTPGWELHSALRRRADEPIVDKRHPDSFRDTALNDVLRRQGIERLILCGAQSDFCVDTTCRRAASEGYRVVLAADAHATFDNGVIDAATIVRHENRTLRSFARVADSATLLGEGLAEGLGG